MKKLAFIFVSLIVANFIYSQPMSGVYYIGAPGTKPGGGDPEFQTLFAACSTLTANGVSGDVLFLITSDLTENNAVHLGVNPGQYFIIFKPSADEDRTITFTKTSDNTASSGGWIFGLSNDSWTALATTRNIIIDGFANGGSTKRLTLQTAATANANHTPIHIIGDVNNFTVKNCKLYVNQTSGTSSFGAVSMRSGRWSNVDYIPDSIVVDNCEIVTQTPSGAGIFVSNTTANSGSFPEGRPEGLVFQNNVIAVKHRAISLNYSGKSLIYNNTIYVNQPGTGLASFGIGGTSAGLIETNVINNKILQLSTGNTGGGGNGIRGIQASAGGTWNIINNFITGFNTPSTGTTEAVGIRAGSSSNIYNNTIVLNNISTTGPGTTPTACIATYIASCDFKNNILITKEDDFKTYCIYVSASSITSDFNVLYREGSANSKIGYYNSSDQTTLTDWQTASNQDQNSVSKSVTFVSPIDLRLSGTSIGDNDLIALPLPSITVDIDGNPRDPYYPYKGAHEPQTVKLPTSNFTVSMDASLNNLQAFGNGSRIGSDGFGIDFYVNWDASFLYLGWSGGRTNYSSDMYYAAIDIDPDGSYGTSSAIEGVSFLSSAPNPDYYVVYENNSSFYGVPASNGNAFEVYASSGANWQWVSRWDGNDNVISKVIFADGGGEVRVRIPWSILGNFAPGAGNKLGIVMWNNNANGDYMWARFPLENPAAGNVPKILTHQIVFNSTAAGVSPALDYVVSWLPVELVSFDASVANNAVVLSWSTASETQNYGWEIERKSVDNKSSDWKTIGFVKGAGNSNSTKHYSYVDNEANKGTYVYRLKQIDYDGKVSYSSEVQVAVGSVPVSYSLSSYPNPFNPAATIKFELPQAGKVKLLVYDIAGRLVSVLIDEYLEAGTYEKKFDGTGLASGTYIAVLQAGSKQLVKKMLLMK